MFESAKNRHAYDRDRQRQSIRRIWQAPGHYHVVLVQSGNPDWIGYWSSKHLGMLPNKAALGEFLDYATHVVDNARKVGMIGDDRPVTIYAFHEAQMGDHCRILGIPDVSSRDGEWMEVKHRHPFVPVSYTRMSGFDEFGAMDFSDMSDDIQDLARRVEQEARELEEGPSEDDGAEASDVTDGDEAPAENPDDSPRE